MRVVIAGGGIAGLTVAGLLSRTGSHDVTVLERAHAYGEAGYGIGLYPLGSAVFSALGAMDDLVARSTPLERYVVHGPDGAELQAVDLSELLADFGPMLGVSRADLVDVLASRVPADRIRFGQHATGVERTDAGVVVRTRDGGSVEGDVVVAADGMHSALRASLFGEVAPRETGFDAWMWWAPADTGPAATASEFWGPAAFVGLYPMPGRVNVAVAVPSEASPAHDASAQERIATLRAHVERHAPGPAAIPGLWGDGSAEPFLWPMSDVRAPRLTALDDRVALVGDAGIGFLPTAGVGASNALRAAAALAYDLSLADTTNARVAVQRWRDRVQRLVTKNQDDSRTLAKVMMIEHATVSRVVNTVMRHVPVTAMTRGIVESMRAPF